MLMGHADQIIDLYERHALTWDTERDRSLFERPWLDRFRELVTPGGSVLDLGCGSGEPIARHFIEQGFRLTGVDASQAMIATCRHRFPEQTWIVRDMRTLDVDSRFDGIIAWDSFFHLSQDDQRRMFPIFQRHARPNAALMFTSGPRRGEAIGSYKGEPLFHSSLDPDEYRALLHEHGFEVVVHVAEDPTCGGHTIWLARARAS
jgi:2-polyprenyl-3-methyl-5-hydroxy-6-metoxy-1,4-benzoquinol methylase